ncbi:hypothetical protein CUJ90_27635 [Paraburkholderia terricola]|nr:hypothetical protein CUJ90_27635 [Paraburkholderia terricola]
MAKTPPKATAISNGDQQWQERNAGTNGGPGARPASYQGAPASNTLYRAARDRDDIAATSRRHRQDR